ncbi:hypothetical protein KCU73_g548, partial [Aureobasidium melanogenum]
MDNSTLLRILTFSKPGNHRIIVIEGPVYTVAYAIKPLAGDNIVTAITHKQYEPETVPCVDPITTVVLLYRNPSKIIKSMVRDHYKNPRKQYLSPGGRIFVELHRPGHAISNYDLAKWYRGIASRAGFELTYINGIESDRSFPTTFVDIKAFIASARQLACNLEKLGNAQGEQLRQSADVWQSRLEEAQKAIKDLEKVTERFINRMLSGQHRRVFATLRPRFAEKVYGCLD